VGTSRPNGPDLQADGAVGVQEATAVLLQTMLSGLAQNCPDLGLVPPLAPGPGAPHMNVCLVIVPMVPSPTCLTAGSKQLCSCGMCT